MSDEDAPGKTAEELQKELEDILAYVTEAQVRVERGETVDLMGLDEKVASICTEVETSPPEIAKETESQLASLVEKLDDLANAIKAQFDGLAAQTGLTNGKGHGEGEEE